VISSAVPLILEIDVGKLLAVVVAHEIAGVQFLDRPGQALSGELSLLKQYGRRELSDKRDRHRAPLM
jgi:hypothetical protein